jgi:hypothetical protein
MKKKKSCQLINHITTIKIVDFDIKDSSRKEKFDGVGFFFTTNMLKKINQVHLDFFYLVEFYFFLSDFGI